MSLTPRFLIRRAQLQHVVEVFFGHTLFILYGYELSSFFYLKTLIIMFLRAEYTGYDDDECMHIVHQILFPTKIEILLTSIYVYQQVLIKFGEKDHYITNQLKLIKVLKLKTDLTIPASVSSGVRLHTSTEMTLFPSARSP